MFYMASSPTDATLFPLSIYLAESIVWNVVARFLLKLYPPLIPRCDAEPQVVPGRRLPGNATPRLPLGESNFSCCKGSTRFQNHPFHVDIRYVTSKKASHNSRLAET